MKYKPVVLIILDGFGISLERAGNIILAAKTPTLNFLEQNFPFGALQASGLAVGLPWGEAGNSEVGHLTMGSGRVIYHHLPRITNTIRDGSFFTNTAFLAAAEHVKKNNSRLHILGLVSSGSVHSHIEHLYALLQFVEKRGIVRSFLHVITDGKDAPPQEAEKFLAQLQGAQEFITSRTKIASLIGRFYAMDRDGKWDRVEKAYRLLREGQGEIISDTSSYLKNSYEKGITDEFVNPAIIDREGITKDKDALIIFNFREDSVREITEALLKEGFDHFPRAKLNNFLLVTMTEYEKNTPALAAFPPLEINYPLGRVVSDAGLRQLRIAETEKYAHVTYFFNGGKEKPFPGEDRILIPSLTGAHFEEKPEMRAPEITEKILENLDKYDLMVANFANADMVGHTGNFTAGIKTIETLDEALGKIIEAVLLADGLLLITGDHGNIELKINPLSGEKITEHSVNTVPLFLIAHDLKLKKENTKKDIVKQKKEAVGVLSDIAPTILEAMNLKKPQEMTGQSLFYKLLGKQ